MLWFLAQASATNDKSSFGGILTGSYLVILLCSIIFGMFFWLWMLSHCLMSNMPRRDKLRWALIIVLLNVIGAIVYFFGVWQPRYTHKTA
jgi:hypothetical protein